MARHDVERTKRRANRMNGPGGSPSVARAARLVLATGCLAYVAGSIVASLEPSRGAWGLHMAGYLAPPLRWFLWIAMAAGAGLVVLGDSATAARPQADPSRASLRPFVAVAGVWLALAATLRVRESLLGDASVWIANVNAAVLSLYSEPLSARLLDGFGSVLSWLGSRVDQSSLGFASVAAGVPAAALIAGIAREISGRASASVVGALLLTSGFMALFFGYVESYPIAVVFLLTYVWLALRFLRGSGSAIAAAGALALAIASHAGLAHLYASYGVVAWRAGSTLPKRLAYFLAPAAGALAIVLLLGYEADHLVLGLRRALESGVGTEGAAGALYLRPYALVSWRHATDVASALLLAAPLALLLLAASFAAAPLGSLRDRPALLFLGVGAITGLALIALLMVPVAPAQDWDLYAMLATPAAVAGVAFGAAFLPGALRGRGGAGLAGLSACALLSFVLVNANSAASLDRFDDVVSDPAYVSPYGRAYAHESLERRWRERGDPARALVHARAALEAEPGNPRYWTNVGNDLRLTGRTEASVAPLRRALEIDSTRWDAAYDLGLSYMGLNRPGDALPLFRRAARAAGNRPEIWHNLGLAHFALGERDSAVAIYRMILERWPGYAASLRPSG